MSTQPQIHCDYANYSEDDSIPDEYTPVNHRKSLASITDRKMTTNVFIPSKHRSFQARNSDLLKSMSHLTK